MSPARSISATCRRTLHPPAPEPQPKPGHQHADRQQVECRPQQLHRPSAIIAEMERLREQQRLHVPWHRPHRRQPPRPRIDEGGGQQLFGQRRRALQEHAVMPVAAIRDAGKGDELRAHAGGRAHRGVDRRLDRRPADDDRARRRDRRQLVRLPMIGDGDDQRVDRPRQPDDPRPGQGHDSQQIVPVEPGHPRVAAAPDGSEPQPRHERRIQHRARHDRGEERQSHRAEKVFGGLPEQQIGVQAQHPRHHRAAARGGQHRPRPPVERLEAHRRGRRIRAWSRRDVHDRSIGVEAQI